jgi:hypothetical protein
MGVDMVEGLGSRSKPPASILFAPGSAEIPAKTVVTADALPAAILR